VDLRHLRSFLAVAEERHFGKAAKRLSMAQPPLSRQIQLLEAELGFPLFDRSRRRVELTPAGVALVPHARRVFETLDLGVQEARRAAAGQTGRIAVGYLASVALSGLAELVGAFRARSPDVDVALHELTLTEQIEGIKAGRLDVGFLRGPLRDPQLSSRLVRSEALMVIVPAGHALAAHRRLSLSQLADEPFVAYPRNRGPAYFDLLMRLCHDAGFTPRIVQEATQLDIVSLVAAGFGVAIVPGSLRHARRPGAVFRPIVGAPRTDVLVAWRPDDTSPVLRDFLDVLREVGLATVSRSGKSPPAPGALGAGPEFGPRAEE
jgi:DNA-binding transcriptional LysR family regulator